MKQHIRPFVILTMVLLSFCIFKFSTEAHATEIVDSGSCGENLTWVLDDMGNLTISGTGLMKNYSNGDASSQWPDKNSIKTVFIEQGVTSIGDSAFYNCSNLTNITIPESVISIGNSAFYNCSNLTNITIPESVTSIGNSAFNNCYLLTEIHFNAVNMMDLSKDNNVFYKAGKNGAGIRVSIGKNVTRIPAYLFDPYSLYSSFSPKITTVEFEEGSVCQSIGRCAFRWCTSLTSITILNSVTSIGDRAFYHCTSLTSIAIPDTVTSIGESLFYNCSSLTSITIPGSITRMGDYAFYGCSSLTDVTIPDGVASISRYAFMNCENLTSIAIPSSVISIGESAFANCKKLTSITIPDSVDRIGDRAFNNCSSLTSITIPDSVTRIGNYAFCFCSSLTSIAIPDSVTSIGNYAFYNCSKLNHVAYTGTQSQWEQISIGTYNSDLTNATRHYETSFRWEKNCINTGLFCPGCNQFLTRENPEDGSHSYTNIGDISCNDCDFVQSLSSISVYQKPSNVEYELFTGLLNVEDGILQVCYSDGGLIKIEMTLDMVSGFDNTKIGIQTLTVTYKGKTATYDVEIILGKPDRIEILTIPTTLNFVTGSQVDLAGLSLLAYYSGGLTAQIPLADITVDSVDMSTPGIKTVRVGYKGVYTSFFIYVHTKQTVTLNSTTYPESSHNYASNTNESKTFTYPGADSLTLTFSSSSYTESNYDWVYLYDGTGNQIGKYSGSLSGKVVTIPGDTFTIQLTSDSSVNKYGYAFSAIVAETILHNYENNACTICGQFEHGLVLTQDMLINENLDHDLYIDLNGYNLSGTIITNGYKVYGMDSATNTYTCDSKGYFYCVDENGNAIIPENLYTHADAKRYMTIETESGYTFHRFYLGITNLSLAPTVTGFGYKAEFYGDEMVQSKIASVGYNLWLTEDRVVSRNSTFNNVLTLRLKNFDVVNYGETPVNACAIMTLTDGTIITGSVHSYSLRSMVESVNATVADYSTEQLNAVKAMIEANSIMQKWTVSNICKPTDVLIISDTQTLSNTTINTDVYITSTGVATFNNVTINGNIYCYGRLTCSGVTVENVYAYQYGTSFSCDAYDGVHGKVSGGITCDTLYVMDDALDYAFEKWGKQ